MKYGMSNINILASYAAYSNNEDIRQASSSGAIFSLLAERILFLGGAVYGVAMSEDNKFAEFVRAEALSDLDKLRGSKYLQAKIGDTFKNVKKDLDREMPVLFTGVGCQINGLKAFLSKEYDNLYCVDVICHGTPSTALWRKYIENIEKLNRAEVISVNFRCKDNGWRNFGIKKIDSSRRAIYISKDRDPFMQMFLKNFCLRPSCYECFAKQVKRSDLTIGDFWGIEYVAPEMDDSRGVSFIIVRSKKGKQLFDTISNGMLYKSVSYQDAIKGNPCEYESVKRPIQRDTFFIDMNSMKFTELVDKYLSTSVKRKIKRILLKVVFSRTFGGVLRQKIF